MTAWHIIYKEIADRLHKNYVLHKHNGIDPAKTLLGTAGQDSKLVRNIPWLREFRKGIGKKGLDPLHVFASFNEMKMTDTRRTEIIDWWFSFLGPKRPYDMIDFTGCPVFPPGRFLRERRKQDQDELWQIFREVIEKKQQGLTKQSYDSIVKWEDMDFPSFSVFLYWISPQNFMPLDKNTFRLLQMADLAQSRLENFEAYKRLLRFRSDKYIEIATVAHEDYNDTKKLYKYGEQLRKIYQLPLENSQRTTDSDFRLIGFRILKGTQRKYYKVLEPGKPYSFYKKFSIQKDGTVSVSEPDDLRLYAKEGLNINISAVVGRNGSGKSTLTELLYLAIYNIACSFTNEYKEFGAVGGVCMELYYLGNTMYRVEVAGKNIKVYSYQKHEKGYDSPKLLQTNEFKLDRFFYTLAVNYSHYGLNELSLGKWVTALFSSNDGYQVPITVSPSRRMGNIDINNEGNFIMSALLSNLLEYAERNKDDFRIITEDGRKAKWICFSQNKESLEEIKEAREKWAATNKRHALQEIYSHYGLKKTKRSKLLREMVEDYLYHVLLTMPLRYALYRQFLAKAGEKIHVNDIKKYLQQIDTDASHATYRFRQAINFLRYEKLFTIPQNKFISIHDLSLRIDHVRKAAGKAGEIKLIDFIPASFYKADIRLNDKSGFRELSSGEKQRIFAVSSLIYHLSNISSVVNPSLNCYKSVNVIFDEIELYFHPDMQRTFISYLLESLKRTNLPNIYDLNFLFITHSPFILSDIPSDNILFLKKKGDKKEKEVSLKTFGANIHELLMDGFFMQQTLGGFALQQVQKILDFYERTTIATEQEELDKLKTEYTAKKSRFYFVRNSLGEAYISNMIRNHIREIEEKLDEKTFIEAQVQKLKAEVKRLEGQLNSNEAAIKK